jgi:hypothetical protein
MVTTTVLPGHVLKIERLERGSTGGQSSAKVAEAGDVLEVSFQLRFKDSGELIDGVSSVEAAESPTMEKNMFFVLGSGRYDNPLLGSANDDILPPGWDQYLYGMVVDELRRISIPPSLGVDAVGFDPHLSLASGMDKESKLEGKGRRGNLKMTRGSEFDEAAKMPSIRSLLQKHPHSDLELAVRVLSINGERPN